MKKFKALYKVMYDDLKDAEMMIDQACKIREKEEDKPLAEQIAKYAHFRLNHFMEFHKLFQAEAMKQPSIPKETVGDCMWEETYEMMQKWYNEIKHKIEKY